MSTLHATSARKRAAPTTMTMVWDRVSKGPLPDDRTDAWIEVELAHDTVRVKPSSLLSGVTVTVALGLVTATVGVVMPLTMA